MVERDNEWTVRGRLDDHRCEFVQREPQTTQASPARRGDARITIGLRTAIAGTLALAGVVVHSYAAGRMVAEGDQLHRIGPLVPLGLPGHVLAGGALAVGAVLLGLHWRVGRWLLTAVAVMVLASTAAVTLVLLRIGQSGVYETARHALLPIERASTMILLTGPLTTLLVLYVPTSRDYVPRIPGCARKLTLRIRAAAARRSNWFV